jgi:DNA helicase-2/ATP-dependent DNA helicase PcrA
MRSRLEEKELRKQQIEEIIHPDSISPSQFRKMIVEHKVFGIGNLMEIMDYDKRLFKFSFAHEVITLNMETAYSDFLDKGCLENIFFIINSPYEEDLIHERIHEDDDSSKKKKYRLIHSDNFYYEKINSLAYYNSKEHDLFTNHIIGFKEERDDSIQIMMRLLETLSSKIEVEIDYVVRAYGHNESLLRNKPIDDVGKFLAKRLSAEYKPMILKRHKVNSKLSGLGHSERVQKISGAYKIRQELIDSKFEEIRILVIDDVTTSGSTLAEIGRTFRNTGMNIKLYGFCLSQTIRHNKINKYINSYINNLITEIVEDPERRPLGDLDNNDNESKEEMKIFADLAKYKNISFTEQQKQAVMHTNGPALVLAVPGGGKTTTLMGRTANLIYQKIATPSEILSVTFSKASADDMTKRFNTLFDFASFPKSKFSTIHSFGFAVIRSYGNHVGVEYNLIEGNSVKGVNKTKIIRSIYRGMTKKYLSENELDLITNALGYIKNVMASKDEIEEMSQKLFFDEGIFGFAELQQKYELEKRKHNYLDFDDLLTFTYEILCNNPHILKYYQDRYKYIQIDEGQDTSLIQHMIIKILAEEHKNVFYVADDDQSIYRFRGSTPEYLLKIEEHYDDTKIYKMEQNFRSTRMIVGLANEFIKTNKTRYEKNIFTENEDGENIDIIYDYHVDPDLVVDMVLKDGKLSDNAILYRENLSALNIIPTLMKRDIPFYIKDFGKLFFTHWTIVDMFSISEFAVDNKRVDLFEKFYYKLSGFYISKDMVDETKKIKSNTSTYDKLRKVSKNDMGRENINRLERQMDRLAKMEPETALDYIVNVLGYGDFLLRRDPLSKKLDDVKVYQFIKALDVLCLGIENFTELKTYIEDLKDAIKHAGENKGKEAVVLSTLHSSKGLEWKNVYLIDLDNGVFPSDRTIESDDPEDMEEERRLCYVGITRAKKKLRVYGGRGSVFTEEIENVLDPKRLDKAQFDVSYIGTITPVSSVKKSKAATNTPLKAGGEALGFNDLTEGLMIQHAKFGEGCITKYDKSMIHIMFNDGQRKKLSTAYCLEHKIISSV